MAGLATLGLVWARRFEPARVAAALAVAAIVAGWALAQSPQLPPGLTVRAAAAPHDALLAVTVAVVAGGVILFPALATLFRLALRGRFDPAVAGLPTAAAAGSSVTAPGSGAAVGAAALALRERLLIRLAAASLLGGIVLVNVADSGLAHAIGALFFFAFIVFAFGALVPLEE